MHSSPKFIPQFSKMSITILGGVQSKRYLTFLIKDEEGSALASVLIIIVIVSVFIGVILWPGRHVINFPYVISKPFKN